MITGESADGNFSEDGANGRGGDGRDGVYNDVDNLPCINRVMARTRNAVKRQKLESVLFNPDVVFLLATFLDAQDLRQVSLTCKALGAKQAAYNGLSLAEESARQMFECASKWERSCLPKRDDEGWVELYRHLLMLRSKLTFDQFNTALITQLFRPPAVVGWTLWHCAAIM
mmetsp:Transcript_5960/g.13454  ORF Transcript_5960/g.13454 Transcript_5960/m.13454 type:complete len:171 (+) Transcript_5960:1202-1714(+)